MGEKFILSVSEVSPSMPTKLKLLIVLTVRIFLWSKHIMGEKRCIEHVEMLILSAAEGSPS